MNYIGIDAHKKYSFCSAVDDEGIILAEAREVPPRAVALSV